MEQEANEWTCFQCIHVVYVHVNVEEVIDVLQETSTPSTVDRLCQFLVIW